MRLNRTNAQFRDRDRLGETGKGSVQDQACAYFWKELVGEVEQISDFAWLLKTRLPENWKRRTEIVEYCASVADHFVETEQQSFQVESQSNTDPAWNRRAQAALFENEVKVRFSDLLVYLTGFIPTFIAQSGTQ
jgi:hypothetical protein